MDFITKLFGIPLGFVMWAIFKVIPNYGVALLVFTLLTRVIMIPLTINQQKSSAKMSALQPEIKELQEKYKNNKDKMNEEMTKLYSRENYNPMSGCLPMLIQFPILFGLIDVIYHPLTHIMRLPVDIVEKGISIFKTMGITTTPNMMELEVIKGIIEKPIYYSGLGTSIMNAIANFDYSFLGMNLLLTPNFGMITGIFSGGFDPVILIPILSGVSAFISSKVTMQSTPTDASTAGTMKGMMLMMPLMSFYFAFRVPAGVGLYWAFSNIIQIVQGYFMNKFHNPKDIQERIKAEQEERKETERQERLEAKKLLKSGKLSGEAAELAKTQKEQDRAKLTEARRRDAEKYGEVFTEDDENAN